jgi:hypothetical protein
MKHPYDAVDERWDRYRTVIDPMTEEQRDRIAALRDRVGAHQQAYIDVLLTRATYHGAITREGTLNKDSADALIRVLEREAEGVERASEVL